MPIKDTEEGINRRTEHLWDDLLAHLAEVNPDAPQYFSDHEDMRRLFRFIFRKLVELDVFQIISPSPPPDEVIRPKIGDVLKALTNTAIKYCNQQPDPNKHSIQINCHMNSYRGPKPSQALVDAVVVDFINFFAAQYCVDLAFYDHDLRDEPNADKPSR